jgi:hypothetical protein
MEACRGGLLGQRLFQKVCRGVKIVLETDICIYCKELGTANFVHFENIKKYMFCVHVGMLAYVSFSKISFVCLFCEKKKRNPVWLAGEGNPPKYFHKNTAKLSHGNKMRERSQVVNTAEQGW